MTSPPTAILPTNPSELHSYAFANACLRVYTIVSLRDKFKKDVPTQTEASRGLHWEMAALFDHLSTCKMFGPVPIPTAVVPMLTHYTTLYAENPAPAVNIHTFPFEYNEFMTSREHQIQGHKWWEPLLDPASVPQAPQSQLPQQAPLAQLTEQQSANDETLRAQQLTPTAVPQPAQGPAGDATTHTNHERPHSSMAGQPQPDPAAMSTVANPYAPYLAINQTAPLGATTTLYVPPAYAQRTGSSQSIPYQPPAGPVPQATASALSVPPAGRQAIIAPPVKAPRQRKRAVKTSEFINEDETPNGESISQGPIGGQEQAEQANKENGVVAGEASSSQTQRKRPQDTVKVSDYIKLHEGFAACGNCITHGRKCLTSKDTRLKRCLECRVRQSRCIWPVPDGSAPAPTGLAQVSEAATSQPAPPDGSTRTSVSEEVRAPNWLVAEVVVTPARKLKRKAHEMDESGGSGSKRGMHLRSSGPVHREAEDEDGGCPASSLTPIPSSVEVDAALGFEERLAAAHGDRYVRAKLALLVDMARTAEMRLADVLGRVAELEVANQRMEKMIVGLTSAAATPKRK